MSDIAEITLPPRLVAFGAALAPLAERLRAELEQPLTAPISPTDGPGETLTQHLARYEHTVARILQRLADANTAVLAHPAATEADAHRVAALLEAEIDRLLDGRAAASRIVTPPLTQIARRLLPAAYTRTLREILAWLDDLVRFLASPKASLEAQGLWNDGAPSLDIEICLTLTSAPELNEIVTRVEALTEDDWLEALDGWEADQASSPVSSPYAYPSLARIHRADSPGCFNAIFDFVWEFAWTFVKIVAVIFVLAAIVSLF